MRGSIARAAYDLACSAVLPHVACACRFRFRVRLDLARAVRDLVVLRVPDHRHDFVDRQAQLLLSNLNPKTLQLKPAVVPMEAAICTPLCTPNPRCPQAKDENRPQ